jgi:HlyD family secretion protein
MDRPRSKSFWRGPKVRTGLLVLVGGTVGWLLYLAQQQVGVRELRVSRQQLGFARVAAGIFRDTLPVRARVTALHSVFLDAQAGGRIETVLAQAGDQVSQGQLLAQLSNSQWQLDVLEREARLVESISQLESYQTTLEQNRISNERTLAQIDYEVTRLKRSLSRRSELVARSAEPAERLDQVRDELDYDLKVEPLQLEANRRQEQLRNEQLPQIREQLKTLESDLLLTRAQLQKLEIRAPIVGTLTAFDVQVGESHGSGDRFGEIMPNDGFKLTASVDEYYLQRVKPKQTATITIDGRAFEVQVARVYPKIKDGVFEVDFAFANAHPQALVPGEHVDGVLTLSEQQPAVVVDAGPFIEQTGGRWVFVVSADGRSARKRSVTLGRRTNEQLEVLAGLTPGEEVIVSSYENLSRADEIDLVH